MNLGVISIAAGGFLLGGAYSIARLENEDGRRSMGQVAVAVGLLVLAAYLIVSGILGLLAE
ncbi:MAG: hypothetical protein M3400_01670 [Actinomycetota bacterium]|nr:hypothetical protein [Actinomycetota bacterium]